MLVSGLRRVVGAIDVSPVERGWESLGVKVGVWSWSLNEFLLGFLDRASFLWEEPAIGRFPPCAFNLNLGFRGRVLLAARPSVDWDSEGARFFNTEVVGASHDLEETGVTPVSTPRVSDPPVFDTIFNAVTNNGNGVINGVGGSVRIDDATSVVQDVSSINAAGDWTSLVKLGHDGGFRVREIAKFVNGIVVPFLRDPAAIAWVAVSAKDIIGTAESIGVATGLVW